jgi:cation diffusion facilitator CzcD-associated flavoprotein CzcO
MFASPLAAFLRRHGIMRHAAALAQGRGLHARRPDLTIAPIGFRERSMSVVEQESQEEAAAAPRFASLAELEAAIRRDLEILEYPAKPWLKPRKRPDGAHVHDVIVVGGGHSGIAAAFGLMRERMGNLLVIDENTPGREGPWQSYARMPDLRTRKTVTGMEFGYPNLTFRAYYEARESEASYADLPRIYCDEWTGYLMWLRRVLEIPVQNETRLERLVREDDVFRLETVEAGKPRTLYARRVVLAWGPMAMGGCNIPEMFSANLPRSVYRHVYEDYDTAEFAGKRIAMIGAGASGFDNASDALERGAAEVHMLVRRPWLWRLSIIRWTDFSGFLGTYADLDDLQRAQLMKEVQRNAAPPPIRAINRAEKWPNFHIQFDAPVTAARMDGEEIVLTTPKGETRVDVVLLATGFAVNPMACGPLRDMVDQIAIWDDRFTPPADMAWPDKYRNAPYLGRSYQFLEKKPGAAPWLAHLYNFNQSATLSMGPTGRVSGLKYGVRRLVSGVANSFLREDFDRHLASVRAYNDSELDGHPWVEPPRA